MLHRREQLLRLNPARKRETMKLKNFMILAGILTTAAAVYAIHSQTTPKPLRSFLVTEVMSAPGNNKPYLSTWTSARAVREDGSWVMISIGSYPFQNERDIYDFKSGILTIVDDETKSVVRKSIAPEEYKHRLMPAVSCEGNPAGRILDIDVNYTEEAGSLATEHGEATTLIKSWVAPDLGCFVLQKETIWTRKSDGLLLTDTKVTPIAISFQPVEESFHIPASYTQRTREEVLNLLDQKHQQVIALKDGWKD
jgi:hypothetical protein